MQLDIVADLVCPWCYIGVRRLAIALRKRPKVGPELNWRPFLLAPDVGPKGLGQSLFLVRAFGTESRTGQFRTSVENVGRSVGIEFRFDLADFTPQTLPAHRLVRLIEDSRLALQFAEGLYEAYFCRGEDIGDRDYLYSRAVNAGLASDLVLKTLDDSDEDDEIMVGETATDRLGIHGVPSFIFAGRNVISGAHDETIMVHMIDVATRLTDTPSTMPA